MIVSIEDHFQRIGLNQWLVSTNTRNDQAIAQSLPGNRTTVIDKYPSCGPLGGLLSSLLWLKSTDSAAILYTCPCDTPFITDCVFNELLNTLIDQDCDCVVASSNHKIHPTIGVWKVSLCDSLEAQLTQAKNYRFTDWVNSINTNVVDFSHLPTKTFANINSHQDIDNLQ